MRQSVLALQECPKEIMNENCTPKILQLAKSISANGVKIKSKSDFKNTQVDILTQIM